MLVKTHRHQNGIPPGDKWILVGGHTRGNRNLAENFRASITVSACEEMRANHRNPLLAMIHFKKRQKTMQPTQMWSLFDRIQARQPGRPQVVGGTPKDP